MKLKRNLIASSLSLGMLSLLFGAFLPSLSRPSAEARAEAASEISLSGIQMRGAYNSWYYYLVFLSPSYDGLGEVEGIEGGQSLLSADKIRLYLSADDAVGKTLSELTVQHVDQDKWGVAGCFVNFKEYDSSYGGHQVYKVAVEKGCLLPFAKDGSVGAYAVDADYVFTNNSYGDESKKLSSFDWSMSVAPIADESSVDAVQLRGVADLPDDPWYHYLVVSSPSLSGLGEVESVEQTTYLSSLEKVTLYRNEGGSLVGKRLSELGVNHSERNKWGQTGVFFAFDSYKDGWDGSSVYKITIEKGALMIYEGGTPSKGFTVDNDYTFYNSSYGNSSERFSALSWSKNVVDKPEVWRFVEQYMHTEVDVTDTGTGKCDSEGWYISAKNAYSALSEAQKRIFVTDASFTDMLTRYNSWAAANGDSAISSDKLVQSALKDTFIQSDENRIAVYSVAIFGIVVSSVLSVFFLRNKKKRV